MDVVVRRGHEAHVGVDIRHAAKVVVDATPAKRCEMLGDVRIPPEVVPKLVWIPEVVYHRMHRDVGAGAPAQGHSLLEEWNLRGKVGTKTTGAKISFLSPRRR